MTREDLIQHLRRNMVETGSLVCLGCGRENSCSTHGCRILREAADQLAVDATLMECKDQEIAKLREAVDRQAEELEFLHQRVELDKQTIVTMGQSLRRWRRKRARSCVAGSAEMQGLYFRIEILRCLNARIVMTFLHRMTFAPMGNAERRLKRMDLINREDLRNDLTESVVFTARCNDSAEMRGARKIIERIESAPTIDAVPVEAYEQVKWERDQATDQLNSIGKGFGEKMDDVVPVVHGRWIFNSDGTCHCSECLTSYGRFDTPYCPNCGAKMDKDGDE